MLKLKTKVSSTKLRKWESMSNTITQKKPCDDLRVTKGKATAKAAAEVLGTPSARGFALEALCSPYVLIMLVVHRVQVGSLWRVSLWESFSLMKEKVMR